MVIKHFSFNESLRVARLSAAGSLFMFCVICRYVILAWLHNRDVKYTITESDL